MMADRYYLPPETASRLSDYIGQCKNLELLLDKYPPIEVVGNSQGKSSWLRRLELNRRIDNSLAQAAFNRWYRMIIAVESVQHFRATTDWRMVIGLGGETVLETDITLHHLYGIPFIPGSALKGLTRAYATGEIDEYRSARIEDDHEDIKRIFGSQEHAGTVIFFDAMPLDGQATFALDIMNPHYPDYYQGSKPPTNDQDPRPIMFLTVTNTTFVFALAPRNPQNEQHQKNVVKAREWVQAALEKYGIGGKTSAGYGVLKVQAAPSEQEEQIDLNDPEIQAAESLSAEIAAIPDQNPAGKLYPRYFSRWGQLQSARAKTLVARAIVERVHQAGPNIEQRIAGQGWFKAIQGYLAKK